MPDNAWIHRVRVSELYFIVCTYVKTKKRDVEPTRRQAAVHTGMKALGFIESAPLTGILSSARSSESHH